MNDERERDEAEVAREATATDDPHEHGLAREPAEPDLPGEGPEGPRDGAAPPAREAGGAPEDGELEDDDLDDGELEDDVPDDGELEDDVLEDDELEDGELEDDGERRTSFGNADASNDGANGGAFRESDLFKQQRKRLESTLRDVLRKAVERGVDAGVGAIEQSVDVIERSMEVGRGRVKSVRDVIDEVKIPKDLPKDLAGAIFSQIEEGKNVLVGAVASEVRGFLEETDIAYELQRALTSLSFEISTEIRFVPNERGIPRAEVRSKARPKVSTRRARRRARDEEDERS